MRKVYLRMEEERNFTARVSSTSGTSLRFSIHNSREDQLVLKNPKLRRGLVHGITLVDEWGNQDKWFFDDGVSRSPMSW